MSSQYPPDARCVECGETHVEHDQIVEGFFTCASSNGGHEFRPVKGQEVLESARTLMLTKDQRWELLQLQNRLVEDVKSITRIIEQGFLTHVGKKELVANVHSIGSRLRMIPCRPVPEKPKKP